MPRFNMNITDDGYQEIQDMMKAGGIATQKELLQQALSLLRWAMRESRSGRKLGLMDEEGNFAEVVMPALDRAKDSKVNL